MTEATMDQELAEQIKEHIAANAEYDMAVIESDGDSRMSFHSDDGADGVEEVDAVMGDVPVVRISRDSVHHCSEYEGGRQPQDNSNMARQWRSMPTGTRGGFWEVRDAVACRAYRT